MAAIQQVGLKAVVLGMSEFSRGTSIIRKQMGLTGAATRRAAKDSKSFGTSLNQTGSNIRNFGNQILILGFQLTFLASGAMVSVINAAAQFEKEMTKINTLVGVSAVLVAEWSDQLLDLAPKLGKAPRELAEGLFFITSAGIRDATTAMDVLEISAKAAAIGMGDVKDVANAVTSVMQAWASTGITAAKATDILTATVREGKTQAEELAPSIGRVIPLAATMGVSFEEVGAFIATFTRLGVPAAVAVTSLRSALTAILKPTSKSKEALKGVGLSMDNVKTSIEEDGLAKTLIQLAVILEQDNEAFGDIIGSARGLTGVLAVTGDLSEDYIEILNNLENSAGITAEGFETVSKTTAFMADQAKASALVLATSFGQILLPGINQVLEATTRLFGVMTRLAEANPGLIKLIGIFAGVVTVIGPLLIVGGLLLSSVGTLITAIGALAGVLGSLLSLPLLVAAAFGILATAIAGSLVAGFIHAREEGEVNAQILAIRAFKWGEGVILAFAEGMAAAISAVLSVLIELGNSVAFWLMSLSPPRLLPNIDKWGTATMQAWLDGFLKVDFGIFNTLSGTLEGFIRSLRLDDLDVVPKIKKMRKELLNLIHVFSETGNIAESSLNKVAKTIGKNNAVIKDYIKTFVQLEAATKAVAKAQAALNAVNERFDEILKPLTDELKEIDNIRQDELDKLREEELLAMIKDPRAPQRVKELAMLELRQIELKKQVRTAEEQRDVELDALNAKLELAQKEQEFFTAKLKSLTDILAAQTKENQLIQEQIDLIESLNKKLKQTESAFQGPAGGIGVEKKVPIDEALQARIDNFMRNDEFQKVPEEIELTLLERIDELIRRVRPKLTEIFTPTKEQLAELGKAWAPLIGFIIDGVFPSDLSNVDPSDRKFFTNYVQAGIDDVDGDTTIGDRFAKVLEGIIAEGIKLAAAGIGANLKLLLTEELGADQAGFFSKFLFGTGPITFDATSAVTGFFASIKETLISTPVPDFDFISQGSIDKFNGFQDSFNNFFSAEGIKTAIEGAFSEENKQKVLGFFSELGPNIQGVTDIVGLLIGDESGSNTGGGGFNTLSSTMTIVGGVVETLARIWEGITKGELFNLKEIVDKVKDSFHNLGLKIANFFQPRIEAIRDFIRDHFLTVVQDTIDILFGEENSLGNVILDLIESVLTPFEEALGTLWDAAQNLLNKLEEVWRFLTEHKWKVPGIVEESSPSEWTLAMMHASEATGVMIDSMNMLQSTGKNLTNGMSAGANMTHAPLRGGGGGTTSNTVNFGGQNISNNMDMAEFIILVQQTIRNEL